MCQPFWCKARRAFNRAVLNAERPTEQNAAESGASGLALLTRGHLQVMDYENTADTLLPLVGASFVMHAMGRTLTAAYKDYERLRAVGRFDTLPELHALSSGMKAVITSMAADGMESCRRTCGGHGYSLLSGLPSLFASYVQNCTWEGDNNVLLLQVLLFSWWLDMYRCGSQDVSYLATPTHARCSSAFVCGPPSSHSLGSIV